MSEEYRYVSGWLSFEVVRAVPVDSFVVFSYFHFYNRARLHISFALHVSFAG
jgi:hypothetical protein